MIRRAAISALAAIAATAASGLDAAPAGTAPAKTAPAGESADAKTAAAAAPEAPADPYSISVEDNTGFQKYRRILDRMPFGALPADFDPDATPGAAAAAAQQSAEEKAQAEQVNEILKKTRICALNVNPDGKSFAGITIREEKGATKSYYLSEGQEQDGWILESVDVAARTAKVKKDGLEATLSMDNPGQMAEGQTGARPGAAQHRSFGGFRRNMQSGGGDVSQPQEGRGRRRSFAADLRARRAEEARSREAREAEERRKSEEIARRESELRRESEQRRADFEELRNSLNRLREEAAERERREREEEEARNQGDPPPGA